MRQHGDALLREMGVGIVGTSGLVRFGLDEFEAHRIAQSRDDLILQLEQVGDVFLETIRPEMRARLRIYELGVTSPTWTPMRNSMRRSATKSVLRIAIER
jgi:hypothetical protein